jgi:hypothetical protein
MALDPAHASFRFYAELNDHLPPGQRYRTVERDFLVPASVKDMIESFVVPRTEVDLILVNGESSAFSRPVQDGDRVAVYPVFESLDRVASLAKDRLCQHRVYPLGVIDHLCDAQINGQGAEHVSFVARESLFRNQEFDHFAGRYSRHLV